MRKLCLMLSFVLSFTFVFGSLISMAAKDKKAPTVVSTTPKKNNKNVKTNAAISIKFSEKVVKSSKFKQIKLLKGKKAVKATVKISGKTITIKAKSKLAAGTKYTVTIPAKAVKDKAGNNLKKKYSFSFTTQKATTPAPAPTQMPIYWDLEGTPAVKFIGRMDTANPDNVQATWPGSTFEVWFEGTQISAALNSAECYVQVIIDSVDKGKLFVNEDKTYVIAENLEQGVHHVQLVKCNENWNILFFKGFTFGNGRMLAPEPQKERKIEFVGDSITCGYGVDAKTNSEKYSILNSNAYNAYGSITARTLNAEQHTIAVSGIGVLNQSGPGVIQKIYERANINYGRWNFETWQPQVVVVNICTNDMGSNHAEPGESLPSKEKFGTAYIELLTKIRSNNPDAHIICAVGPMVSGSALTRSRQSIKYAIDQFNDSKVSYLEFATQSVSDGIGADWHPSKKTQQKMAKSLVAEIKRITGWE